MSFRARLYLAVTLSVLVPLAALAIGFRREMERRLGDEYRARVGATVAGLRADLSREGDNVARRLSALGTALSEDNRFRLATVQHEPSARRYLLDYAAATANASGLSLLQIQDSGGRILSSAHFRNAFDRAEPELPRLVSSAGSGPVLVRVPGPEAPLVALARTDSFVVAGQRFSLTGGVPLADRLLAGASRDPDIRVSLAYPGSESPAGAEVASALAVPYLDLTAAAGALDTARLIVTQSGATLHALRRGVDAWFFATLIATAAAALVGAAWLAARISRPLTALAEKTGAIDLDRLDQDFATERDDEIGTLSRVLGTMTERLRLGAVRLREAERRVVTGDLARQVNHDIKNGLVPIRNVVRHLGQVATEQPEALAAVFQEREGTLESSLSYLDTLARNYARLAPELTREPCDVNAVVEEVVRIAAPGAVSLRMMLQPELPRVSGDQLVLRRVLQNLVGNAVESLAGRGFGGVTVITESATADGGGGLVRITVADDGPGMSRAELDRAFDDFYTTKDGGTGLGLSIVRRLVLDLNGRLRIETAPGAGTRAVIELPAAGGAGS
ncbi:MAG TPA: HAMP domain-containing sensor histidine kinase [Gemmatimonadales bacterium]|jgi:signal transduction histidine kinase|nr:HAMP domain-containing sensor histidine kinase [Gemmatimonadales bacterium]